MQYNPNGDLSTLRPDEERIFNSSNGSLIAVGYEARAKGVKRCESCIFIKPHTKSCTGLGLS